jgi:hypothetical protein
VSLSRPHSSPNAQRNSLWKLIASSAIMISTSMVVLAEGASADTVGAPHVSATTLSPAGGSITLSATPSANGTCGAVVSPAGATTAASVPCKGGVKFSVAVGFVGNTTSAPKTFKLSVRFCSGAACASSASLSVRQWANKISVTQSNPPTTTPVAAACPTVAFCMIIGTNHNTYADSVTKKNVTNIKWYPDSAITTVACSSATFCVAADLHGYVGFFNGKTWSATGEPSAVNSHVASSSCSSAQMCDVLFSRPNAGASGHINFVFEVAVSGVIHAIGHLSDGSTLDSVGAVTSISCVHDPAAPNVPSCFAVDDAGHFYHWNNGAGKELPQEAVAFSLSSLSCTSPDGKCVSMSSHGTLTNYRTKNFVVTISENSASGLGQRPVVACADAQTCVVSGSNGFQLIQNPLWPNDGDWDRASPVFSTKAAGIGAVVAIVPRRPLALFLWGNLKVISGRVTLVK